MEAISASIDYTSSEVRYGLDASEYPAFVPAVGYTSGHLQQRMLELGTAVSGEGALVGTTTSRASGKGNRKVRLSANEGSAPEVRSLGEEHRAGTSDLDRAGECSQLPQGKQLDRGDQQHVSINEGYCDQ